MTARAVRTTATVALWAVVVAFAWPLVWLFLAALDDSATLRAKVPERVTLDNFDAVLTAKTTGVPMLNSLLLCGFGTLLAVTAATLAAYPLSRFRSRMRRPFLMTLLFAGCLPITAVMVPVYGVFVQVELIDTMVGTVFFLATTSLPFAVWLMKNAMDGVPIAIEEAAAVDGASLPQLLRTIVLPLAWPGVVVVTVFTFVGMWGNFFVPFMLLLSPDQAPMSVGIFGFFDQYGQTEYGQLAAFSLLYTSPVLVLYLVLSRKIGGGFALGGALKG